MTRPSAVEVNFDSIVGPTHNYAGIAPGNLHSARSAGAVASPRRAARQGLDKMKALADRGYVQAVLPPQLRPDLRLLRSTGFAGDDAEVLAAAAEASPALLSAACSASSMWAANAATVSPSADTADGRLHLTPANLVTNLHRSIEGVQAARTLRAIFADDSMFCVHDPLPATPAMADEGAANHGRLCARHGAPGVEVFVYGMHGIGRVDGPKKYPARQTRDACMAIARLHGLDPARTVFVKQCPAAIDAGVFHNDVISVMHEGCVFAHEAAFELGGQAVRAQLQHAIDALGPDGPQLAWVEVPESRVSLSEAVRSYLFNSQLLSHPSGEGLLLVAPTDAQECDPVREYLAELVGSADTPIREVMWVDVRESMRNGGGPACLRLRVAMTEAELAAISQGVLLTDALYTALCAWIDQHYREELAPPDLADPALLAESRAALADLEQLLGISGLADVQTEHAV
ncbi:MAG: N-succinylarginine dihydrolase [Planctomycetota bacterium]